MKNRIPQLRVKLKSLAAESVILRNDAKKHTKRAGRRRNKDKSLVWTHDLAAACSLHEHRVTIVRRAARETLLALAALRGATYARCENRTKTMPDFEAIAKVADRFGPERDGSADVHERLAAHKEKIANWIAEAKTHLEAQGFELPKALAPASGPSDTRNPSPLTLERSSIEASRG